MHGSVAGRKDPTWGPHVGLPKGPRVGVWVLGAPGERGGFALKGGF